VQNVRVLGIIFRHENTASGVDMSKSAITFQRWRSREDSTWPFQVFREYNFELERILFAHISARAYVYRGLKAAGAAWTDDVHTYLSFHFPNQGGIYSNLKDWSNSYNQFDNWTNLNSVIALTSNLETYMASVISLALESDPGLLLGISRGVDGASILKHGSTRVDYDDKVTSCTKGEWQSRSSAFAAIFGSVPSAITDHLSELDKIRNLRNKVGHAFGRDIDQARKHGVKNILPMETLKLETTLEYRKLLFGVAKAIDVQLIGAHIGEFQAIQFYHELYPRLRKDVHSSERAVLLKKEIGRFKAVRPGKLFCKELVKYYEAL
jgi:hypothetical protein